jgi:hypothetical protein
MGQASTLKEFVGVYENIVPTDVCKGIVAFYDKNAAWKRSTYSGYEGVVNTPERVAMDDCWIQSGQPYFNDLVACLGKGIERYAQEHPDFSVAKSNGFRINRYGPSSFMSRHVDNIHRSHGQKEGFPLASCSIILNENFEGGEFVFFDDYVVPAREGQAVIFPSNFLFPHEVKPIRKGVRYSIVTWML